MKNSDKQLSFKFNSVSKKNIIPYLTEKEIKLYGPLKNHFKGREKIIKKNTNISKQELRRLNDNFLNIFNFYFCNRCNSYQEFYKKKKVCDICHIEKKKKTIVRCISCKKEISCLEDKHFFGDNIKNCFCKDCFPYDTKKLDLYYICSSNKYLATEKSFELIKNDYKNIIHELKFKENEKLTNSISYILYCLANKILFKSYCVNSIISKQEKEIFNELKNLFYNDKDKILLKSLSNKKYLS